jgi:prepilin-type N-terminal cleavage/methylation domain-containing protein
MTRSGRSFSLLEVIVALGVLSIGASAAFALLVAAAAAGRRAEHQVNAALIAETMLNEANLDPGVQVTDYPLVSGAEALPGETDLAQRVGQQGAGSESRFLVRNQTWSEYPDYSYDVVLTPIPGPVPNNPWQYLIEVEVRWSQKGQRRSAVYSTIRLRQPTYLDPPQPRQ